LFFPPPPPGGDGGLIRPFKRADSFSFFFFLFFCGGVPHRARVSSPSFPAFLPVKRWLSPPLPPWWWQKIAIDFLNWGGAGSTSFPPLFLPPPRARGFRDPLSLSFFIPGRDLGPGNRFFFFFLSSPLFLPVLGAGDGLKGGPFPLFPLPWGALEIGRPWAFPSPFSFFFSPFLERREIGRAPSPPFPGV